MEDYPRDLTEFEARFANEAACRDYLFRLRWPAGFKCPSCGGVRGRPLRSGAVAGLFWVPGLWRAGFVLLEIVSAGVRPLPVSNVGHGRNDIPGYSQAAHPVVSSHVVGHQSEERSQCPRDAKGVRSGKLQDSLDVAPQTAAADGPSGTRSALGHNRGGRDL